MLDVIRDSFPLVYGTARRHKPHSREYTDFQSKWGGFKTFYEICDEKIEKIGEVNQIYLNDFLQYLSYMYEKQEVEEIEDKFQDARRRSMKGR